MKKSILFFVFFLSTVFAFGQASNYQSYDYAFCDLLGKVKKVTIHSQNPKITTVYVFSKSGKMLSYNGENANEYYLRDTQGRIVNNYNCHYCCNWNGMQVVSEAWGAHGSNEEYRYIYDRKGSCIGYTDENGKRHTYKYLKHDSHGNWTSRTDGKTKETRTIEYF